MQTFIILAVLVGGFVSLEARNLERSILSTKQSTYVAPGTSVSFSTDPEFKKPRTLMGGTFITEENATFTLSCSIKLHCLREAYIKVTDNLGEDVGYYCTVRNVLTKMPDASSLGEIEIELYSGNTRMSQYVCSLTSTGTNVTVTPPMTTVTVSPSATTVTVSPSATTVTVSPSATTVTVSPSATTVTVSPSTTTVTVSPSATTVTVSPSTTTVTVSPSATTVTTSPPVTGTTCRCGTKGGRIVGGTPVTEGEIPWQVGLGRGFVGSFSTFCGGTLVSEIYVITAAHCVKNTDTGTKVFLGSVNLRSTTATVRGVETITRHEQYDEVKTNNDIAVMKLATVVTYSSTIFPACLPRSLSTESFAGKELLVSGWGTTVEGASTSPTIMLKATVVGITNVQCQQAYGSSAITSVMLCASKPNTDSCQGDSGGPLTYTTGGVTYLAGVVSWGIGCARPQFPGVYTRVTSFLSWIDSKTGGPLCSK